MGERIYEIVVTVIEEDGTPFLQYQYGSKGPVNSLSLWVLQRDRLIWRCPNHDGEFPFTVHFSPVSPLVQAVVLNNFVREGTIREDVTLGRYKCFVAVHWEGQVVTDDPDIIVDPRRH